MKTFYSFLILLFFSALLTFGGNDVEKNHLKLYASFDHSAKPEIALEGSGFRTAGKLVFIEGKSGKALRFSRKSEVGDLLYNLGTTMNGKEWSIAMWICPEERPKKNGEVPGRNLFRTNFGWGSGNVFAGFDNWGRFILNHFDAEKKYRGAAISAAAIPYDQWTHIVFGYKNGKHVIYLNGIEAAYTRNNDVLKVGPNQTVLRIGSMDFRSRDQFGGSIDELKLFNKLLTASEAKQIMETTPGKEQIEPLLFAPFEGKIDAAGISGFNAAQLLFTKGRNGDGVKVVRHGYDRKGSLVLNGISGIGGKAVSTAFYFLPDWNGTEDSAVHGLFHVTSGSLKYGLAKQGKQLCFSIQSDGKTQEIVLPAALLKKGKTADIATGFDFDRKKMFLAVNGQKKEAPLTLSFSNTQTTGSMTVGDIPGSDNYSRTQAEGVIDELLAAAGFHTPEKLAELQDTESRKSRKSRKGTIAVTPVKEQEKPLWDLNGAERITTPTREKITLNALWRMQLTDKDFSFDPTSWIYLAVPGRYSGQGNGMTDCEFYMRDANLKKLPRKAWYRGKNPYTFTNGWFERAFLVPEHWKNKQIVLLLDELSRSQKGTVYLNGREIAKLDYGKFFELPLPQELLRFDEYNTLTIHAVDDGQYWAWRGIKGNTWIEIKPRISAEYPWIITSVKNGTATFEATVRNTSDKAETVILEAKISGENAPAPACSSAVRLNPGESKKIVFSAPWKNARFWSPETPYLYHCTFTVKNGKGGTIDVLPPIRFGFREFELRGRDYYLNGQKIHLFNHDGWANASSDLNEARRIARTLKRLGYNAVRTNFPVEAKDNYPENIMRVCDEEGLLQLVGIDGVTGREFALWNNPAVRKNLEERMAAMIRRWRNHPSNIIYFMSTNYLGYGWDYHPLKLADGYLPKFQLKKYQTCMEGVKIMRKYDSSRPFFFQAGGNFGEIITNNAYFCWWPQTERNAWPEVWNRIGKKPLHIIETGFPYWRSFYGMDLKYPGQKPLFYYENLARYYGPEVYRDNDPEMLRSVALSTRGKSAEVYYDAPLQQKLRCDLLKETIHYWRGFDMSGICPFGELNSAFRRNAPHRTNHISKEWEVEVKEFRKNGWHADLRKLQYQVDINPDQPLPVAKALKEALAPKLVFLDGGAEEPVDKTHNYTSGEKLEKRIVLINDTLKNAEFRGKWILADKSGTFCETLNPGEVRHLPLSVTLPNVDSRTEYKLIVETESLPAASMNITVFPAGTVPVVSGKSDREIALYDPKGFTAETLKRLKINLSDASKLDSLNGIQLLLIGRESLSPEFMPLARKLHLRDAVNSGKLNLIVFEQKPEALALLGLKTTPIYAREVFPGHGFTVPGMKAEDFSQWAGNGTLAPAKQPPAANTEDTVASPLWHWNNANIVSSYPVRRVAEGDFRILLSCGKDLIYTPLFELKSGKGRILFCQMEISGRTKNDPAADLLAAHLIAEYTKKNRKAESVPSLLAPDTIPETEIPKLLRQVQKGAVLIVPPGSASLFGVSIKAQEVNRFELTAAGRKYWPLFTARDTYLRAPQRLNILSGTDLIPLTNPAFAAERKLGKGKLLFLEFPREPQKEELERGLKSGADSSSVWSAEILAERFRQMRSLAEAACGKHFYPIADRFEQMHLANRTVDLNGKWELRTDPEKAGRELGWQTPAAFGDHNGWENISVPGYFNRLLPHVGMFIGTVWYRKSVVLPEDLRNRKLFLDLGAVDDLDTAYVNGIKIGQTTEETDGYWTARRLYPIPAELTKNGRLHIALETENLRNNGGITGYARILVPAEQESRNPFPYSENQATYHTETHIRW